MERYTGAKGTFQIVPWLQVRLVIKWQLLQHVCLAHGSRLQRDGCATPPLCLFYRGRVFNTSRNSDMCPVWHFKWGKKIQGEILSGSFQKRALPSFCRICPLICKQTAWTRIRSLSSAYRQVPAGRVGKLSTEWKTSLSFWASEGKSVRSVGMWRMNITPTVWAFEGIELS